MDCDHIGWKSSKLIAQTISPTNLLFINESHPPTPRGAWGIWGDGGGGVGESRMLEHKSGNISETCEDKKE